MIIPCIERAALDRFTCFHLMDGSGLEIPEVTGGTYINVKINTVNKTETRTLVENRILKLEHTATQYTTVVLTLLSRVESSRVRVRVR